MREACRRKPDLCVAVAEPDLAEDRILAHAAISEAHHRMAAGKRTIGRRDRAHDLDPRMPGRDQEHRRALVVADLVRRARHDDEERRAESAGDEVLVAVDHELALLAPGGRGQHAGIRACTRRRLGHRERRADVAASERSQVPLTLRLGRDDREQVHVALVGGVAVERVRAERRVARSLEDPRHAAVVEPEATEVPVDGRREDPGVASLLVEAATHVVLDAVLAQRGRLERYDDLADERANALGDRDGLSLGRCAHRIAVA